MLTKITTVLSFVIFVVLFSWQVWIASMQPHDDKATSYRDQSATKEIKPQSADERIALYTEWLAAFTGLLAVVSAVQGIFLFRADKTARISADAARAAAEAAGDAVQLGRDEFNASHRPKVRVREIEIATDENYTSLSLTPGNIVRARFAIANIGESDTRIVEVRAIIYKTETALPMMPPHMKQVIGRGQVIRPAEIRGFFECVDDSPLVQEIFPVALNFRTWSLYVMGFVMYTDLSDINNKRVRRTYFCRLLRDRPIRFNRADNPDYEDEF